MNGPTRLLSSQSSRKSFCKVFVFMMAVFLNACNRGPQDQTFPMETRMVQKTSLPAPIMDHEHSLEETIRDRRSIRDFSDEPLSLDEISQLLWAAQGITDSHGYRTAPSAGALYPIELYIATADGLFHYDSYDHSLTVVKHGDLRENLSKAALNQEAIAEAPMILVFTAVYERVAVKYGSDRTPRYVHLEVGHAAQNVLLQAVSLDLGAVPIGAFYDKQVQSELGLPNDHAPLYLIPVGKPQ
jgi:SagB-type dehydrogenase family enzyme